MRFSLAQTGEYRRRKTTVPGRRRGAGKDFDVGTYLKVSRSKDRLIPSAFLVRKMGRPVLPDLWEDWCG